MRSAQVTRTNKNSSTSRLNGELGATDRAKEPNPLHLIYCHHGTRTFRLAGNEQRKCGRRHRSDPGGDGNTVRFRMRAVKMEMRLAYLASAYARASNQ